MVTTMAHIGREVHVPENQAAQGLAEGSIVHPPSELHHSLKAVDMSLGFQQRSIRNLQS
jgi:hypothetical protein